MLKLRLRFLLRLCWLCGIWFVPGCGEDLLPEISRNLKGKTTEHADIWYYKHHALVEDLQREYPGIAIHGDHIITHAGERVELISGDSVYLGQLYQQRNSAHAKLIYHAYRNTLAPYFDALYAQESLPPVAHRDSFIDIRLLEISVHKWIFDKSIYLGVSAERMESLFLYDSFLAEVWHADDKFRQIVRCFFDQIVQLSSPMPKTPLEGRKKRLQLVVTSGFGGGHLTAGRAMQSVLSQAGYDVRLEDTLHLGQSQDPLFVFTGGLHEETVYERYVQQQSDMGLALKVWDLFNRLRRFIPSESNALLEQRIREFKPDMILAPIHNRPELYQLAYSLDVPLALVSTDYELQHLLPDVLVNLDPAVARVLTTTKEPEFFVKALGQLEAREQQHPVANKYARAIRSYIRKVGALNKKVPAFEEKSRLWQNFLRQAPVFDVMGLPVNPSIYREEDLDVLARARLDLGVTPQERVMLVTMGRQADGQIKRVLSALEGAAQLFRSGPIAVVVLCGKNQQLYLELQQRASLWASGSSLRLLPQSSLSPARMGTAYSLSDLVITKPGGATTAELIKTGSRAIIPYWYGWEEGNYKFLQSLGLAKAVSVLQEPTRFVHEVIGFFDALDREDLASVGFAGGVKNGQEALPDWSSEMLRFVESWLVEKK